MDTDKNKRGPPEQSVASRLVGDKKNVVQFPPSRTSSLASRSSVSVTRQSACARSHPSQGLAYSTASNNAVWAFPFHVGPASNTRKPTLVAIAIITRGVRSHHQGPSSCGSHSAGSLIPKQAPTPALSCQYFHRISRSCGS